MSYLYAKHGIDSKEIPSALLPYIQKDVIDDPLSAACKYHHCSLDLVPFFKQLLSKVPRHTKIISVGSGRGKEEERLVNELGDYGVNGDDVICVDPDPQSFVPAGESKDIVKPPKYATIEDLLKDPEDQKLVQNCILLLDWTYDSYDYDALKMIQPLVVVVRYEKRSDRKSAASLQLVEEFM